MNYAYFREIKPHNKGFTLLEIVVAVAIFGVITAIIFPALFQFLDMRERVNEKQERLQSLQKTFQFLANDLRYAANRLSKDEYGDKTKTTISINDDVLLDFTALYPDVNLGGQSVPRRVRWQLIDDELQRVQYPVMDPEKETRSIVQSLLKNVQTVGIQASHIEDGRDNRDDKWEEQSSLPDMIDVLIELEDGTQYRRLFTMLGGGK
jgi:general secretion pathway protein J